MCTCRVRVVSGRPAEPDTSAAGPRPPPSGRARGARKNSTGEARTGVWSCSNCKVLLRGRSPDPEDTGRLTQREHRTRLVCLGETPSPRVRCRLAMFLLTYLLTHSEGHGDHTDWISCYGVNHYPIGGIVGGQSPGTGKKTPGQPVPVKRLPVPVRHTGTVTFSREPRLVPGFPPSCLADSGGMRAVRDFV
jgi:hypothetical protein